MTARRGGGAPPPAGEVSPWCCGCSAPRWPSSGRWRSWARAGPSPAATHNWVLLLAGLVPLVLILFGLNPIISTLGPASTPSAGEGEPEPDRVLATVLFVDMVGSTQLAATVGDRRWVDLVAGFHDRAERQLERFRGRLLDTAGDGMLATFDGPARAVRCATAIRDEARDIGIAVRAGLHSGEVERGDGRVRGIGVHMAARVIAEAAPGEVLVTSTVRDLVSGSGIEFEDRGLHPLKGVPSSRSGRVDGDPGRPADLGRHASPDQAPLRQSLRPHRPRVGAPGDVGAKEGGWARPRAIGWRPG